MQDWCPVPLGFGIASPGRQPVAQRQPTNAVMALVVRAVVALAVCAGVVVASDGAGLPGAWGPGAWGPMAWGPVGQCTPAAAEAQAQSVVAVPVVVDPGDLADAPGGPETLCLTLPAGATGRDVLIERARVLGRPAPRWDPNGLLCAIDGYPASGCGERTPQGYRYWAYSLGSRNTPGVWWFASLGPASHRAKADVVEGWRFVEGVGNATDPPPRGPATPAAICAPAPAPAPVPAPAPPPPSVTTAPPPPPTSPPSPEPSQTGVAGGDASAANAPDGGLYPAGGATPQGGQQDAPVMPGGSSSEFPSGVGWPVGAEGGAGLSPSVDQPGNESGSDDGSGGNGGERAGSDLDDRDGSGTATRRGVNRADGGAGGDGVTGGSGGDEGVLAVAGGAGSGSTGGGGPPVTVGLMVMAIAAVAAVAMVRSRRRAEA